MRWNWIVFVVLWPILTVFAQFARGYMNAANMAKYGPDADYRANLGGAILGTVFAGAVYAAVFTAIAGLMF